MGGFSLADGLRLAEGLGQDTYAGIKVAAEKKQGGFKDWSDKNAMNMVKNVTRMEYKHQELEQAKLSGDTKRVMELEMEMALLNAEIHEIQEEERKSGNKPLEAAFMGVLTRKREEEEKEEDELRKLISELPEFLLVSADVTSDENSDISEAQGQMLGQAKELIAAGYSLKDVNGFIKAGKLDTIYGWYKTDGVVIGKNPSRDEINNELRELSEKLEVPLESLQALIQTESSYRQFTKDGNFLYGKNPNGKSSSAVGLTQMTRETTVTRKINYERFQIDWKYNLSGGTSLFAKYFKTQFKVSKNVRQASVEAYSRYHQGASTDGSRRGYYTDRYLKNFNKMITK